MNWGDNPVVSNMLHREYNDTIEQLTSGDVELDEPQINANESLPELRDRGFTPRMLSRANLSWQKAVRRFGVRSLVEFGIDWEMALEMGMSVKDLEYMNLEQLHKMCATADSLAMLGATFDTLLRMQASATDIIELGFTTPLLEYMGTTVDNMHKLGIDQSVWENLDPREKIDMEPRVTAYDSHDTQECNETQFLSPAETGGTDHAGEVCITVLPTDALMF